MAKKTKDPDEKEDATSDGSIAVNDAWTGMLAISLLALMIGTGFLAWDYFQYDEPKAVPKLTGTPPKSPPEPAKPADKVEKKDDVKDKDDKQDDKKGAGLRLPLPLSAVSYQLSANSLPRKAEN